MIMVAPYHFVPGTVPLLVSLPHDSTHIPDTIARRMTAAAIGTPDTDWHVARLYDFAQTLGASVLTATHSRYVIDLNRDPAGTALYDNADNTELCPLTTFDFQNLYRPGKEPDEAEISQRTERYWRPYHTKIADELSAMKARFGVAVLFDGHTIKSTVPRFFDGLIPDLNLGTADGASCIPDLADQAFAVLSASEFSAVHDDRFTGGHITRNHGRPADNIHALQLELTWRTYMDEDSFRYLPARADRLKTVLAALFGVLIDWTAAVETSTGLD